MLIYILAADLIVFNTEPMSLSYFFASSRQLSLIFLVSPLLYSLYRAIIFSLFFFGFIIITTLSSRYEELSLNTSKLPTRLLFSLTLRFLFFAFVLNVIAMLFLFFFEITGLSYQFSEYYFLHFKYILDLILIILLSVVFSRKLSIFEVQYLIFRPSNQIRLIFIIAISYIPFLVLFLLVSILLPLFVIFGEFLLDLYFAFFVVYGANILLMRENKVVEKEVYDEDELLYVKNNSASEHNSKN